MVVIEALQKSHSTYQGFETDINKFICSSMDLSSKPQPSASQGFLAASSMALNFSQGESQFRGGSPLTGSRSGSDSFPYGISGVAMPNYGYPSDLYQFTSNGYPRKSRTCSYCGKVFTRSTTRRYHEKRCPLLRAAVCSMVPSEGGDNKNTGGSEDQGISWPSSSASLAESRKAADMKLIRPGKSLAPLKSIPPLLASPLHLDRKYLKELESSGYASTLLKKKPQEFPPLSQVDKSQELSHNMSLPFQSDRQGTPFFQKFEMLSRSLSPISSAAGVDLSKSPSRASPDDSSSVTHEDYERESTHNHFNKESVKVENGHVSESETSEFTKGKISTENEKTASCPEDSDSMDVNESTSLNMSQDVSDTNAIKQEDENESETAAQSSDTRCEICGKNFPSAWQLHVHKQIHTKFKPYACRFCGDRFDKAALRITHERAHLGESGYTCAVCGASFSKRSSLRFHVKGSHTEGPWICRHCGSARENQKDFSEHLQGHNLSKEEHESLQYLLYGGDGEENSEEDVEEELNDSEAMSDSIEYETSPREQEPENLSNLDPGLINSSTKTECDEAKEICTICGHEFPASHIAFHMKVHEGQKPYSCPICGKRFGYKNNMKSHIKLHAGIKPYQCSICGAKFTRGSTLRRHARRHGISAESVWDLFVKNSNSTQQESTLTNISDMTASKGSNMTNRTSPDNRKDEITSYSDSAYSSFFNTPTSVAMSNALFMSYQNHQAAVAAAATSFPSIFNTSLPNATSELPLPSSRFLDTSHHTPQEDALNLSVHKEEKLKIHDPHDSLLSPNSDERLWSNGGSAQSRPSITLAPGVKENSMDIGIQVKRCCKSSLEFINEDLRSPSEASIHSDHSGSTYQQVTSSGLDNSTESISTLLATGRLYKCDHCECYFSEYAMYRIHSKLHARGGEEKPFACPVCDENCQDKTYFSMHLAEHLR